MKRECETCIKRKTVYCPTSMECMATNDMPYYQNRIMLLEENKLLKEVIDKAREYIDENKDKYYQDWGQDDCSVDIYLDEYEIKELLAILKRYQNEK